MLKPETAKHSINTSIDMFEQMDPFQRIPLTVNAPSSRPATSKFMIFKHANMAEPEMR